MDSKVSILWVLSADMQQVNSVIMDVLTASTEISDSCWIWTDLNIFILGLWNSPWTEQSGMEIPFNLNLSEENQRQELGDNPAPKAASAPLACLSLGKRWDLSRYSSLSFCFSASCVTLDMELPTWFGRMCHWSLHFPKSSMLLISNKATCEITEKNLRKKKI